MEKLKKFLNNFQYSSTKTIGKEFAKYIANNRDMFDDYGVLEKKISSYNELYGQVKDFIISKRIEFQGAVDIDDIVGTDHFKYVGLSYLEMIEKGIKMDINIPLLIENPIYYFENKPREPNILYATFNFSNAKKISFVEEHGNHRTTLAKVIRALDRSYKTIYNVKNTIYQVDYKSMEKFFKLRDELKKYGYYLEVRKKENGLSEDISGKWIEWRYKLVFLVEGKNMEIEFDDIDDIRVEDYMGFWDRIKKKLGLS